MENVDYVDTFLLVAADSAAETGTVPPGDTVAARTYRMIAEHPYRLRSSEVIFGVWAERNGLDARDRGAAWRDYYAKPRACLRSSDLGKKWGWGVHADAEGRLALYPVGSPEYEQLAAGRDARGRPVTVRAAMRTRR